MRTLILGLKGMQDWEPANQYAHRLFGEWIVETGGSAYTAHLYGIAARIVFGLIDQPYKLIDPDSDLQRVRAFIEASDLARASKDSYLKGVDKFEQFLRIRCGHDPRHKELNWSTYVGTLPEWACSSIQAYIAQRCRSQPIDKRYQLSMDLASHLTVPLRWMVAHKLLTRVEDLTPRCWRQYVDYRIGEEGLSPVTMNVELAALLGWLRYLSEDNAAVNPKMLAMQPERLGPRVPKDVPVSGLQKLLDAIQADAEGADPHHARLGKLDLAWCLLMLHSGLRTGEVRRLKLSDIDFERKLVRIEQSKGLKDRLVPLSEVTIRAIQAYLAVKGPKNSLPDVLFVFRNAPLSTRYCHQRLRQRYARIIGITITPHRLRHSCATLLLNAGAPITTVKQVLGHQRIDTTLGYARLYDGTIAADFYRAMRHVDKQIRLADTQHSDVHLPRPARMLALADALKSGTLNDEQADALNELRVEILSLSQPMLG
jgi:site-specific recombinase XerD